MLTVLLDETPLIQDALRDRELFAVLYERYRQQLYRYLLARVGNVEDAQDLTSQTFLVAMQEMGRYRQERPFIAWLFGIARHKAADHFRRRRPEIGLDAATWLTGAPDTLDEQVGRQLDLARVAHGLRHLSPARAEALTLRLFGGLDTAAIAQVMGRRETAVRMLIFRGLRDLRQQLAAND
jgi:RNA polymerase sigma-70 factor, ECF subfamily